VQVCEQRGLAGEPAKQVPQPPPGQAVGAQVQQVDPVEAEQVGLERLRVLVGEGGEANYSPGSTPCCSLMIAISKFAEPPARRNPS
jgi:hypothetical protein